MTGKPPRVRRLRRRPIRTRIIVGSTAVVVALIAAASIVVYLQISSIAVAREKAVLHSIAEIYRSSMTSQTTEPEFMQPGAGQHVAIVDPDGNAILNTFPASLRDHVDEIAESGEGMRQANYGGETYYVYAQASPRGPDGSRYMILVTRDSDIAAGIVSRVVSILWALVIGSALLFALGAWGIATAALRPVERLRRSAEHLASDRRVTHLLPVGTSGDEIDALAQTLNRLIADVRSAVAREQQMVADASHELRNPLAVLRAQLELVDGTGTTSDNQLLAESRETLDRVIRLAQSMLELSRLEAGFAHESSTLGALTAEVTERVDGVRWRLAEPDSPLQGSIDLRTRITDDQSTAQLTPADLGRVTENLVDNALHSARGRAVHVRVTLRQEDDALVLRVSDDGPGFDPLIVDRAFERFTRSETSDYAGGGLGLAIVARVAELAGGETMISSSPDGGAEVGIRVPVSPSDAGPRSPKTHQR